MKNGQEVWGKVSLIRKGDEMIRADRLKEKKYPDRYKDLYEYLYKFDFDILIDEPNIVINQRTKAISYYSCNFIIYDSRLPKNIRITQFSHHFVIKLEQKSNGEIDKPYLHEILEYYSFKTIEDLLTKLKELINPFIVQDEIEYEREYYSNEFISIFFR